MTGIKGNTDFEYEHAVRKANVRRLTTLVSNRIQPPQALMVTAVISRRPELFPILKEAGSDPNEGDGHGETALARALSMGSAEMVEALLEVGADPNRRWIFCPLDQAVFEGRQDLVDLLLKYGANPNAKDRHGGTALLSAVRCGHLGIVRSLLEAGADPWHEGPDDLDSFALAEKEKQTEILVVLRGATKGKIPSPRRNKNPAELLINALKVKDKAEVERCLASGVDVNIRHKFGWSPLDKAIDSGDLWFVHRLLKAGADPNDSHPQGRPPLVSAVSHGNVEIVKELLDRGAKIRIAGWDALAEACVRGEERIAKILLDAGGDPNGTTVPGVTSLMFAVSRKLPGLVQKLLKKGARVDAVDSQGYTALFHAVQTEMVSISIQQYPSGSKVISAESQFGMHDINLEKAIRLLLEYGTNVNHQDEEGRTALTYATTVETGRLLIEAGARLNILDKRRREVACWLKKNGLFFELTTSKEARGRQNSRTERMPKFPRRNRE
jgi:ankyrin repeat protein